MSEPLGIQNPILPSPPLAKHSQNTSWIASFIVEKTINNTSSKTFAFYQETLNDDSQPSKGIEAHFIKFDNLLNDSVSLVSSQRLSNISSLSPFQEFLSRFDKTLPQTQTNSLQTQGLNLPQKSERDGSNLVFTPEGFKPENSPKNLSQPSINLTHRLDTKAEFHHPESLSNNPYQNSMPVTNPQAIIQDLTEKTYQKIIHRLETKQKRQNSSSRLPW